MKNSLLISALAACAFAPTAFASGHYFKEPYVGVEVIQTNQDFKTGFGKKVFKKNPQNYSVFAGFKFSEHFGAELGYEFQPKKNKGFAKLVSGDQSSPGSGVYLTPGTFTNFGNISYKSKHPYVGLFGEYATHFFGMHKIRLQALIGASISKVNANYTITANAGNPALNIFRSYSKSKVVPMVKLSAIGEITRNFGAMVSLNYRNMSAFKITSAQSSTAIIRMKDSFGVGLGLTYMFG